jgi:HSP20 family protein
MREGIYKKFTRRLTLPAEVDIDKASSSFKNGTLRITLPKKESRGRKIKIE